MTHAFTVLSIVSPVFALATIGWLWVRLGHAYDTAFVTRLAMTLAVPCLVFVALARSGIDPGTAGRLAVATLAAYAMALAVFWVTCRAGGLPLRTYLAPLSFGNTGNIGLPLALFAFGETGLGYAVVVLSVTSILQFTLGLWIVAGGGNPVKMVREPMVWATVLGAVFLWQGWSLPDVVFNTLDLVGQLAIPLMLITLGVAIARIPTTGLGRVAGLAVLKAILCTAIGWGVGLVFALDPLTLAVLVVQLATPVAVTSYLLAVKYDADAPPVASLVVVSTALSVGTLPLILGLFV